MFEQWVDIADYPNYAVSNRGRVLNKVRDSVLSPRKARNGALRIVLSKDGVKRDFYIHHLVADAFFRMSTENSMVYHSDGDKENNTFENLRVSRRQRETVPRNEPLFEDEYIDEDDRNWGRPVIINETDERFRTVRDCARYIHGDYSSIYACLRGERKTHRGYTFRYSD